MTQASMNMLVSFHTGSNAGYAMAPLERTFYDVAKSLCGPDGNVYFAFNDLNAGAPTSLPTDFPGVLEICRQKLEQNEYFSQKVNELADCSIDLALCFDLQPKAPLVNLLRKCHVRCIASYLGSSMSSINTGPKLLAKKIEVLLARDRPDLFIFESEAMRLRGTHGRGLPKGDTTVIHTGVDIELLRPQPHLRDYVLEEFRIPTSRKIAIYSGHMEERKGVHVLIEAMQVLVNQRNCEKWHLLICGNRPGEEKKFEDMLANSKTAEFVTFAGYRDDLAQLMPGSDVGVIASTGWDSFPMSALEMAACGLPLVVSRLQGLVETVAEQETGILFEPGNSNELASILNKLAQESDKLQKMSIAARHRIEESYSLSLHREKLLMALSELVGKQQC